MATGSIEAQALSGGVAAAPEQNPMPQPTFNFDDVSWGETRQFAGTGARLIDAGNSRDMAAVEAAFKELTDYLTHVVVSVPREWLVSRAPTTLDWTDPASFDWLKSKRMMDLVMAAAAAQSSENVTGN